MAEQIAVIGAGTMGPADAVRGAGIVLTMVPTIAAIEETMPSVLSSLPSDAVWLQMSTIVVAVHGDE